MADNKTNTTATNQAAATQPMTMPGRTNIFGMNDAKRMSFDGNMPYSVSPTTAGFGIASGLMGATPTYNRDRRDSLKNMVHLQDFGTDWTGFAATEEEAKSLASYSIVDL